MTGLTLLCAAGFAAIHLFIGRLRFLDVVPRSRWLSAAGGVAVAYVFLHVLPELAAHQDSLAQNLARSPVFVEELVYLLSLIGLAVFYGLERIATVSRLRSRKRGGEDAVGGVVFWAHIGAFAVYNLLIGYLLLHREESGLRTLLFYFVAIGLHFVTSDFGLRAHHKRRYDALGRWIIAAAVLAGWGLGGLAEVSDIAVAFLFALLAGGVVLNVLKEELPEDRESRFWPFLIGATASSVLLLAM